MLKKTLNLIDETSLYSDLYISEELDISKDMANDLVENLIRMGYLVEDTASPNCETTCRSCPYAKSCGTMPLKTFKISPKGKKILKAM